jgi:hypothetical protein
VEHRRKERALNSKFNSEMRVLTDKMLPCYRKVHRQASNLLRH